MHWWSKASKNPMFRLLLGGEMGGVGKKNKTKKSSLTIFGYITSLLRILQGHCVARLLGCQCTISHLDHYSSKTLWTLASGNKKVTRKKTLHLL